ncbi:MAG: carbohydrate ABC transporter permease [Thermomicrobiales bacterium]
MARYDTWRDKVLMGVIYLMLIGVTFIMLYPFWDQLVLSLSTRAQALQGGIRLLPSPITWDAYREVLDSPELWKAARNTALRVIAGTLFGVYITALTAYPLSRDEFPLRRFWTILIVFTMLFSGGLIPNYLLRKDLNLLDNPLVLILPGLSAFNVIILRNFFRSIPPDLTDAAQLDGASDWQIWRQIVMPLSKPVLATIGLFIAVAHWNAYFDALIYITDPDLTVLQVVLRRVLLEDQLALMMGTGPVTIAEQQRPTPETVKAALVMVTTIPILLIYPFLQRYFIQGTLLGSVKE